MPKDTNPNSYSNSEAVGNEVLPEYYTEQIQIPVKEDTFKDIKLARKIANQQVDEFDFSELQSDQWDVNLHNTNKESEAKIDIVTSKENNIDSDKLDFEDWEDEFEGLTPLELDEFLNTLPGESPNPKNINYDLADKIANKLSQQQKPKEIDDATFKNLAQKYKELQQPGIDPNDNPKNNIVPFNRK